MARIAGVDLPKNKKVLYGLQYIYGIGEFTAATILEKAKVSPIKKGSDLTDEEVAELRAVLTLSLIHIVRCRRASSCRSRWAPYH